ncbi:3',5'-cyclic-nucleotide phosphodiesterase [Desulfuromonas sp.]|nr:3',5'-cyclic-nucleotide phosphodiesterase [Desulfuromonas sp.]
MQLRVLGCGGAELPYSRPPAFLLDGSLLLDAGTVGAVLDEHEQCDINHVLLTHAHLDHTRALPFLADNLNLCRWPKTLEVHGSADCLQAVQTHLMNNVIWPDFSTLGLIGNPAIAYRELCEGQTVHLDSFEVTAYPVNHVVPAQGYLVRKGGKSILYTGDTGPSEEIWKGAADLSLLLAEVSFPNDMEDVARLTGHLTPRLLVE